METYLAKGARDLMGFRLGGLVILLVALSGWFEPATAQRLIDLTYAFDESTQVWPSNLPFHRDATVRGGTNTEAWYATGQVVLSEHAGTHMDAPIHFAQGQIGIDQIPVERLMGPVVVIDVRTAVEGDRDYRLSLEDIQRWEARYGAIPIGAVVMMLTGWGSHWNDLSRRCSRERERTGISIYRIQIFRGELSVGKRVSRWVTRPLVHDALPHAHHFRRCGIPVLTFPRFHNLPVI